MGAGKINIWVSAPGDPCGTFQGGSEYGGVQVLDCKGILEWPCGRFLAPDGQWRPVPNGKYANLPFRCGHLEVEVPPGCYWILAGYWSKGSSYIHFNYTTHVGIVHVGCDETACVKLYNPTARICWDWWWFGMRMLSLPDPEPVLKPEKVEEIGKLTRELLKALPPTPVEAALERSLDEIFEAAKKATTKQG